MYKLSIIVPMYNAASSIERCAVSLFEQTLTELEYIFVDDCSTDNGVEILRELVKTYPSHNDTVRIISHTENRGSAAARNTGLHSAVGEYIGWVDADDWVDINMFEEMYDSAVLERADIVWSDYNVVNQECKTEVSQKNKEESLNCLQSLLAGHLTGALWNKLIKRELFDVNQVKFVEGQNMAEDLRVSIMLFYYAKKVVYMCKSFYNYDKTGLDTISYQNTRRSEINYQWIDNVSDIVEFLEDKELNLAMKREIGLLKLSPKKNLLVKGRSKKSFQIWKDTFPESNSFVWKTRLPFHYKLLAWCADKEIWLAVRFWIFVKYRVFKVI